MNLELKRQKIKAQIAEKQKELRKISKKIAFNAWKTRQEQKMCTENE